MQATQCSDALSALASLEKDGVFAVAEKSAVGCVCVCFLGGSAGLPTKQVTIETLS